MAEDVLDSVTRLHREAELDLQACSVSYDQRGSLQLQQVLDLQTDSSLSGLLQGLKLLPMAGITAGVAADVLTGESPPYVVDPAFIDDLRVHLRPGSAVVFVLVRHAAPETVLALLGRRDVTILRTSVRSAGVA